MIPKNISVANVLEAIERARTKGYPHQRESSEACNLLAAELAVPLPWSSRDTHWVTWQPTCSIGLITSSPVTSDLEATLG